MWRRIRFAKTSLLWASLLALGGLAAVIWLVSAGAWLSHGLVPGARAVAIQYTLEGQIKATGAWTTGNLCAGPGDC